MQKTKKLGLGLAVSIVLTSALAGCSSQPTAVPKTSTPSATSAALPRGVHLTVWSWWNTPEITVEKQLAAQWAKAHGDTVTVVNQTQPFQFFATAARSGKGPDVVMGMPHDNNGVFAQEGLIAPVTNLNPKLYNPLTMDAITINGKVYSYPISVQSVALFYNKKLIPTPPKTWAQFVQDANKHGFGFAQHNLYYDFAYIGGMGGYIFKNNHGTLDPNNIGLASPGAVNAFKLLHAMDWNYHWMNPNTTGNISVSRFESGQIGMTLDGPWDVSNMKKAKIDLGIARIPALPNGHPATPFLGVMTSFVNSRSHNIPSAMALSQYLATAGQMQYFKVNADLPALLSLQKSKVVQNSQYDAGFISALKYAIPMPNIPQMASVWGAMPIIGNIIKGSITPENGATQFVKNIKTAIKVQQG